MRSSVDDQMSMPELEDIMAVDRVFAAYIPTTRMLIERPALSTGTESASTSFSESNHKFRG